MSKTRDQLVEIKEQLELLDSNYHTCETLKVKAQLLARKQELQAQLLKELTDGN